MHIDTLSVHASTTCMCCMCVCARMCVSVCMYCMPNVRTVVNTVYM